jgi:HEPN domain
MTDEQLDGLESEGVIERVSPDSVAARRDLASAEEHLLDLEERVGKDPGGAFALAYEAMRKAIVAHMRANGFRIKGRSGSHYQTGRYAKAALGALGLPDDVGAFERLRRLRNRSAYEALPVDEDAAVRAIGHARALVAAMERELDT